MADSAENIYGRKIVLTHATGEDRRWRICRCSKCNIECQCTPTFDFYGKDGKPLLCETCFRADIEAKGMRWFPSQRSN